MRLLAGVLRCACGAAVVGPRRSSAHYAAYACQATGSRRVPGGHTFSLNMADADAFFGRLLGEHPAAVLTAYRDSRERNALMDVVRALEAEAREARRRGDAEATPRPHPASGSPRRDHQISWPRTLPGCRGEAP